MTPAVACSTVASSRPGLLRVAALVLAAGQSTRFGVDNKLLAYRGAAAVLSQVLAAVQGSCVDSAWIVTGHEAAQVRELAQSSWTSTMLPLTEIYNPQFASGMASSLVHGVAALDGTKVDAVLVCLGDMPEVTSEVIDTLACAFRLDPLHALYIPTWQGRLGNPVLIAAAWFDSVLGLTGDVGARILAETCPDRVKEVPCHSAAILLDIDTPDDLQKSSYPLQTE